jgi:flagella basal body P-ring formation protein FlgA
MLLRPSPIRQFARPRRVGRLWLAACVAFLGAAPASTAIIRLQESAIVEGAVITLADVADVLHPDTDVIARLGGATLAPAPAPGRKLRLDFTTIRGRLAALGFNLTELEFAGRSVVLVTAPLAPAATSTPTVRAAPKTSENQRRKAEAAIAAAVSDVLHRQHPQLGKLNVTANLRLEQVPLVLSAAGSAFQVTGGKPPFGEPQLFEIRFEDQQQMAQQLQVSCQVNPLPRILTVKYIIPKGQVLKAEDLAWLQVRDLPSQAAPVERPELVVGQETTRLLRPEEAISAADLRSVPLVRSGDIVTVYSRQRGIVARIEAKAASSGAMGELVELVTLDRREKLQAQVIGFHEVEVTASSGQPVSGVRLIQEKAEQ